MAWSGALRAPFLLDDHTSILDNPSIRDFWSFRWIHPPSVSGETVSGRPVLNLSFALNHACGELDPVGYHAVNVAIHLTAALLLYGIVRRTLGRVWAREMAGPAEDAVRRSADTAAVAVSLCWLLHPLQTAAVTYVAQRAESLAGMFLLLTLYCFIRSVASERRSAGWQWAAAAACVLGMATKETAVAAPLVVLLYDRAFVAGTFRRAWRERARIHRLLAASWVVLIGAVWANHGRGGSAGFGAEIGPWSYLMTQAEAIPHYLLLVLRPVGLVFDYGVPDAPEFWDALPGLLFVVLGVVAMLWALRRNLAEGFLGACFFLLLAPSSSFVPVATQTIAEHRMYLPLAAIILLLGTLLWRWPALRRSRSLLAGLAAGAAILLGLLTWQRNRVYATELSLWQDTVEKRPGNPRARNNLGLALMAAGRADEAMDQLRRALELQPDYAFVHFNLGTLLLEQGRFDQAAAHLGSALAGNPGLVSARINMGRALTGLGRIEEAMQQYRTALAQDRTAYDAATNLAALLIDRGQAALAEAQLREIIAAAPALAEAHYHLGRALQRQGAAGPSETSFREAVRLKPELAAAHFALGNCLANRGDSAGAESELREALRLDPRSAEAHYEIGNLRAKRRDFAAAMEFYRAALRLDPAHVQARTNLGNCQLVTGRLREAITTYEEVLRLRPGEPTALRNLALAREYLGE